MSSCRRWVPALLLTIVLSAFAATPAQAVEIHVLSAGAVQEAEKVLAAEFERQSGDRVSFVFGVVGAIQDRLKAGERADVIVLSAQAIDAMANAHELIGDGGTPLAKVGIGVAVREGAPKPDISTPEAFRAALLAARSVVYADPAKGASSGIQFQRILSQLGIADVVKMKANLQPGGYVVEVVARGEAELGVHNISEILPVKGVELVGPLPPPLQTYTTYVAGVPIGDAAPGPALAFIKFLGSPAAAARWKAAGFEPP
jgi:molybdate transport system substrate-binding protein